MNLQKEITDIVINYANKGLELQSEDGSMPRGKNGPWNESQTPVRNTAHWAQIFDYAYSITKLEYYMISRDKALSYLLSDEALPMGKSFYCRDAPLKDSCNGLVGQAWALESLIKCGISKNDDELIDKAVEIVNLHSFNDDQGLWYTRNTDGSMGSLCVTLNQQIWFCSMLVLLNTYLKNDEYEKIIKSFLLNLSTNMKIDSKGKFIHIISNKSSIKGIYRDFIRMKNINKYSELEIGYHSFVLHGLANIKRWYDKNDIWYHSNKKKIKKALKFSFSNYYQKSLKNNKYSITYNQTGIETQIALCIFNKLIQPNVNSIILQKNIEMHVKYTTDLEKEEFDFETFEARAYQFVDLLEVIK